MYTRCTIFIGNLTFIRIIGAIADSQFTDALRVVGSDSSGDKRVKKKLLLVLTSWREEYKDDPSMTYFANLYKQCRVTDRKNQPEMYQLLGVPDINEEQRRFEKAKAKEKAAKEEDKSKASKPKTKRVPFEFERVCMFEFSGILRTLILP